jgi:hypothetical protein
MHGAAAAGLYFVGCDRGADSPARWRQRSPKSGPGGHLSDRFGHEQPIISRPCVRQRMPDLPTSPESLRHSVPLCAEACASNCAVLIFRGCRDLLSLPVRGYPTRARSSLFSLTTSRLRSRICLQLQAVRCKESSELSTLLPGKKGFAALLWHQFCIVAL